MANERRTKMMLTAGSDITSAAQAFPECLAQGMTGTLLTDNAALLVGQNGGKPLILHFGRDRSLLFSRGQVLMRTGSPVACCEDIAKVDGLLEQHTHGLLVLCHSVPESDRVMVLSEVKRLRPNFKRLLLARNLFDSPVRTGETETMSTHRGPHGLVQKATELLSQAWRPRSQPLSF